MTEGSPRTWRRRAAAGLAAAALTTATIAAPASALTATAAAIRTRADAVPADVWTPGSGYHLSPSWGYGGAPQGSTVASTGGLDATTATAAQSAGMVLVSTTLDFGSGEAAGTGMVIDGSGIVVTNHHVVQDATSIRVTVASTGRTYQATVLGTDRVRDVAVLQLRDAPTLDTVDIDTGAVSTDDPVTAVGDAGGDGGSLTAATGSITGLHRSITVDDDDGGSSRLRNLIQVDADIIPGDSGGALLDADGDVVGMNVAASSGSADITGYVIPINRVLRISDQIQAGDASGSVRIGQSAMLGIELDTASTEPVVAGVLSGGPAQAAGLTAGDTLTRVDGTSISSADQLRRIITRDQPGDAVTVTWTDAAGASHSADVTLEAAPVS